MDQLDANNLNQLGGATPNVVRINLQYAPQQTALATNYARFFTSPGRLLMEMTLLVHAVLALLFLIYVQQHFLASPLECIEQQAQFQLQLTELESRLPLRDYIVRVHAQYGASKLDLDLAKSIAFERYDLDEEQLGQLLRSKRTLQYVDTAGSVDTAPLEDSSSPPKASPATVDQSDAEPIDFANYFPIAIFEYASAVGYLQLDHEARSRLNLTVLFVVLDLSETGERCCVRSTFERALFDFFDVLDYDELILNALRTFVSSATHARLTHSPRVAATQSQAANETVVSAEPDQPGTEVVVEDAEQLQPGTEAESQSDAAAASDGTGSETRQTSTNADVETDSGESKPEQEAGSGAPRVERGFIKNVLRNEMYQLASGGVLPRGLTLLVPLAAMIVFTGAVAMLLQYARAHVSLLYFTLLHLAFELLRNGLAFGLLRRFPAAPAPAAAPGGGGANAEPAAPPPPPRERPHVPLMLVNRQLPPTINVLLAFIGVQTMMIEFFESEVTALGVMMLVWLSGEYALLLRSPRSHAAWTRCFYLCHLLVYMFHYRCSGHYTELALYTSFAWMLFFMTRIYHVFELPLFLTR